jgi:hypothetical protein
MARPDLSTEAGLAAYRAELKAVGRRPRIAGFTLVLVSALVLIAMNLRWLPQAPALGYAAYTGLAIGWALLLAAIFMRTRHHRRRMAES